MAHFAKIDPNSLVTDIVFVDNAITSNVYIDADDGDKEKSIEVEQNGIDYLQGILVVILYGNNVHLILGKININ